MGAVLAGGRGERMGGDKALAVLDGRPLVAHALDALRTVADEVVVVAKPATRLPAGLGVPVWHDDEPGTHPRNGIVTALRRSPGGVLVLAVDLPRAAPALAALLDVRADVDAAAASAGGRLQPLCAAYRAAALPAFEAAPADEPLTRTVERLRVARVDVPAAWLHNVNRPEDLSN